MVQDALAQTQVFRGDLEKFIIRQELKALFKTQDAGRYKPQGLIRAGGTGVGQVLGTVRQTLTGTSSAFGQTPTTIPP